ncbi:general substrate transporter [Liquorilactobacillus sucicola DSM 21376 = JCM 15457]|uniref:Major facilitator superfamily permease n=2 Tax=Liquorilactobacillus sucicola TaxID=519050 RepID=A0A023CWT6_9LACO|nr:MFS transporter [Liquorilactobacillus sucicola]AJA34333.1 general substrate transporter [Liquorilactobacillus sucicola]KRN06885.1 major facilitator superfamily permease [Liquorilactobacillus sucicola DSM 21376 = JCM 15457]GAJ26363.1 general substrate transporter [Liquorilactobacillus sucicola DSM 21376 = JCM 15457]
MTTSNHSFKNALIIVALLSLNIVEQAASVITGTIPGMAKTFSSESLVNIELITTVVSIFVTVFVLVSGFVVRKIGQKQTAVLGLAIATAGSIVPAFSTNFTVILVSRAILGVGIGLANPLAISLIGVFFFGDERAKLMGWRSAIAGVGTSLMTYFAGQLLNISWHAAYWVYLLFVPTLLLFIFFVPDPEKTGAIKRQEEEQQKKIAQAKGESIQNDSKILVATLAGLTFLILIAIMVLAIKLPTFFVESKIGTATQASNAWSIYNFASVAGGILFGYCYKVLRKYLLPLGLVLSGIGMALISTAHSVEMVYVLCVVMGIVSAMIIPYIFNRISESSSPKKAPLYTSIALVGSNLGSFLSPYAGKILGTSGKIAILNAGFLMMVLAIVSLTVIVKINSSKKMQHN